MGSLAVLYIYNRYHEKWFLEEVYDELLTWNRWWAAHRDSGGYLCWGSDPVTGQLVDGTVNTWQAAAYESGLDNSPMYDNVPFNTETHLMELADVGLMSFYISDCYSLAEISQILGKNKEASELRARAVKYSEKLDTLWDEKTGIYLNKRTDNKEFSYKLSPTNFYPLLAKTASQERAQRMIKEHFFNENEFFGEWIMPSIAKNDPAFKDQAYWRGRIWGPMNFLVYLGMRNYDLPEARKVLAEKSLKLFMLSWLEEGAVYENYNTITGRANDVKTSDGFYHWGALLGVISFMEREGK